MLQYNMKFLSFVLSSFLLLGCYSGKHLLKNNQSLIGKSLPRKVEKTFNGSLRSTQIFSSKDKALIFIIKDIKSLKKVKKPSSYAWRIADVRFKPWYNPSFLYNSKYSKYKSVIIGDNKSLIETLKLRQGNWVISLNQGKITSIVALKTFYIKKRKKNKENTQN